MSMPMKKAVAHQYRVELCFGLILILVPLTLFGYYVALQGESEIPEPTNSVAFGS